MLCLLEEVYFSDYNSVRKLDFGLKVSSSVSSEMQANVLPEHKYHGKRMNELKTIFFFDIWKPIEKKVEECIVKA